MKLSELNRLAHEVCAELGKIRAGEDWTVAELADYLETDDHPWAILAGPGGARVELLHGWHAPGKLTVTGLYPKDVAARKIRANTDPAGGAARVARVIDRRVLGAGYVDELLSAVAKRAQLDANNARTQWLLARAAELFGSVPNDGVRVYLGTRLPSGTVEVHHNNWPGNGQPDGYTLNLTGIPEETALAMLAVLAARTTPRPLCCKEFPGHGEAGKRPGCEVYDSAAWLAKPFDRSMDEFYAEYLVTGDWQRVPWPEWLSQRIA